MYCKKHDRPYADTSLIHFLPFYECTECREEELEEEKTRLRWWMETYDVTMPCGHKNRYAAGEGLTHYCVMCALEAK